MITVIIPVHQELRQDLSVALRRVRPKIHICAVRHQSLAAMTSFASPLSGRFPTLDSQVSSVGDGFKSNSAAWEEVLSKFSASLAEASSEGGPEAVGKHVSRGQVLGSPWSDCWDCLLLTLSQPETGSRSC